MGRALARLMAARRERIFLLGLDDEELPRAAADLEINGAQDGVGTAPCDLLDRNSFAPALEQAQENLGGLDVVVVTAGLFASQAELEEDADLRDRLLIANFVNTVHFCEEARRRLLATGGGTLCVFSSVAGERGSQGLRVVTVKPGFVKTGMTAGLPPPPFAGEPDQVARLVLKAIDRGTPEVYAPPAWRWIMLVIRNLPRAVMRRIGF
jgi:NAD(P)-dependent dehydrogenase (short-subunit alcohol dehydrogenase family)